MKKFKMYGIIGTIVACATFNGFSLQKSSYKSDNIIEKDYSQEKYYNNSNINDIEEILKNNNINDIRKEENESKKARIESCNIENSQDTKKSKTNFQTLEKEKKLTKKIDTPQVCKISTSTKASSEDAKRTRKLYSDIFEKYANIYGGDKDLYLAIATQERGVHSSEKDSNGALGLMQIQVGVWEGETITAFNLKKEKYDSVKITEQSIKDLETNIKVGIMIYQNYLQQLDYNILAALQAYNCGVSKMKKIIEYYAETQNKTYNKVIKSQYDTNWMKYRKLLMTCGDTKYVENVLRYYNKNSDSISLITNKGKVKTLNLK